MAKWFARRAVAAGNTDMSGVRRWLLRVGPYGSALLGGSMIALARSIETPVTCELLL